MGEQHAEGAAAREKWQRRYGASDYVAKTAPIDFLKEKIDVLGGGKALCLAAGAGRNAVYLAQRGFAVTAVDISSAGLKLCGDLAAQRGVEVESVEADLLEYDMGAGQYDLITKFYYYQPELFAAVKAALKPGGLFIFQTFSLDQLNFDWGPRNPAHLVRPNELLTEFADCRLRYYEDGMVGEEEAGVRLIAEKTG